MARSGGFAKQGGAEGESRSEPERCGRWEPQSAAHRPTPLACAARVPAWIAIAAAAFQGLADIWFITPVHKVAVVPLVVAIPRWVVDAIEIVRLLPNWVQVVPFDEW